jgi:hypothetical protein
MQNEDKCQIRFRSECWRRRNCWASSPVNGSTRDPTSTRSKNLLAWASTATLLTQISHWSTCRAPHDPAVPPGFFQRCHTSSTNRFAARPRISPLNIKNPWVLGRRSACPKLLGDYSDAYDLPPGMLTEGELLQTKEWQREIPFYRGARAGDRFDFRFYKEVAESMPLDG